MDQLTNSDHRIYLLAASDEGNLSAYADGDHSQVWLSYTNMEVLDIATILKNNGFAPLIVGFGEGDGDLYWNNTPVIEKRARELGIATMHQSSGLFSGVEMHPRDSFMITHDTLYVNDALLLDVQKVFSSVDNTDALSQEFYEWWRGVCKVHDQRRDAPQFLSNLLHGERSRGYSGKEVERTSSYLEGRVLQVSPWGEGGLWIDMDQFVIASTGLISRLEETPTHLGGKKIYFVDPIPAYVEGEHKQPDGFRNHIDYFVNGIVHPKAGPTVLLEPQFYQKNKGVIDTMRKEQNCNAVLVNKYETRRMLPNFLSLPNGQILMPPLGKWTREALEKTIDDQILTTQRPIPLLIAGGYGIRCATNIMYEK